MLHKSFCLLKWAVVLACLLPMVAVLAQADADPLVLEFTQSQTAVLDPVSWDTVIPDERYFDAIRPMLMRFPGCAEQIHAKLIAGYRVDKVELQLEWKDQEGARPERGRGGWGADEQYKADPGQWHVVVHALRRPWSIDDPQYGPTFNAFINGAGFWARGGGRGDGADRSPQVFGPAPLHPAPKIDKPAPAQPGAEGAVEPLPPPADSLVAKLDVTPVLTDPAYGKTIGERLRTLESCGFEAQKLEIRDMKYRMFWAYDWAVSIGYMKIWVKTPILRVTLRKDAAAPKPPALPPALDIAALAKAMKDKGGEGQPSIFVPNDLAARVAKHLQRPDGIPDWEWQHILQLRGLATDPKDVTLYLGRGYNFNSLFANDPDAYLASMCELLRMPPRTWQGHQTSDFAILAYGFSDLLPPAVVDHLKIYWEAWMHPEVENRNNIGGGNQRGGPSYFRGYSNGGGTMNFGHNATMGALLAGQFLQSPYVLKDAREGVENLSRIWGLGSGAHQEIGDTYYQALSLGAAGAIAKFAEDPVDRLLGRFHRDRLLEPLMSMYHPGLRRMTHPMGRGSFAYHILLQEGPYHVLHTLSPSGTLMNLEDLKPEHIGPPQTWGKVYGLSILGDEAPPMRVSLLSPWTESYLSDTYASIIDHKPLPERIFARDYSPGCRGGGWHVNYLGQNYALASRDNANHDYGVTSVVAHWRRKPVQVARVEDLTTFIMSFERNARFPAPAYSPAEFGIVQRDNKLVALKALPARDRFEDKNTPIFALQSTIAMIALGDVSQREVWVNDRKVASVSGAKPDPGGDWIARMTKGLEAIMKTAPADPGDPDGGMPAEVNDGQNGAVPQEVVSPTKGVVTAKDGDLITIKDGVTYVGLIPIVVNPFERTRQVEISYEFPTLFVHAFLYYDSKPFDLGRLYAAEKRPTAGFVVEMGDVTEYPTFAAFQKHMREVKLSVQWNAEKKMAEVSYASGKDLLEMGFDPAKYPAVYRRVNGQWPYLPDGIMRESCWAIQGSSGHLEKNGAVLDSQPGRHAYLEAVPDTGTYIGYNPLPDPMPWVLTVPGGMKIRANGNLGLARVVVKPKEGRIWIDYAVKPNQTGPEMATALLVFGMKTPPVVSINDQPFTGKLETQTVAGETAYTIPLPAARP